MVMSIEPSATNVGLDPLEQSEAALVALVEGVDLAMLFGEIGHGDAARDPKTV